MTQYSQTDVVKAVQQVAPNQQVALAMLTGSYLESGQDPNVSSVDSNGYVSAGPWEFNFSPGNWTQPPISGNPANAQNPYLAAKAIEPAYAAGAAGGSGHGYSGPSQSEWQTNPEGAAQQTAQVAEGPLNPYPSSRVNSAYQVATQELGGKFTPSASTTSYNSGTNTASIGNLAQLPSPGILSWITDPIGSLAVVGVNATITALLPVFFFVLGLVLVAWGLSIVAHGSPNITVQSPQPSGGLKKDVEHGGEDAAAGAAVAA